MVPDRKEVQMYTRQLYKFLKSRSTIEFKKMRINRGYIDTGVDDKPGKQVTICLDHRDRVLSTLIHEFLHFKHWTWCETDILNKERELVNALSDRQVRNIVKKLADSL